MIGRNGIVVFTDGAAKGNPGPGGWGAIIATSDGNVRELGGRAALTTNNKMELTGAIEALEHVKAVPGFVDLYTDSTYVIQGITQWIFGWRKKGWRTAEGGEVLNREYWERLSSLTGARGAGQIKWHYVRGHVGTPGNERVDEIADTFARGGVTPLYDGPLSEYAHDISRLPPDTSLPVRANGAGASRAKGQAHSYLSLVDGQLVRHATWAECERRVKGRSGARFKKATSPAEEVAILQAWGITAQER